VASLRDLNIRLGLDPMGLKRGADAAAASLDNLSRRGGASLDALVRRAERWDRIADNLRSGAAAFGVFSLGQTLVDSTTSALEAAAPGVGEAANKVIGGALSGAAVGSIVPGIGTAIGAAVGTGLGVASAALDKFAADTAAAQEAAAERAKAAWEAVGNVVKGVDKPTSVQDFLGGLDEESVRLAREAGLSLIDLANAGAALADGQAEQAFTIVSAYDAKVAAAQAEVDAITAQIEAYQELRRNAPGGDDPAISAQIDALLALRAARQADVDSITNAAPIYDALRGQLDLLSQAYYGTGYAAQVSAVQAGNAALSYQQAASIVASSIAYITQQWQALLIMSGASEDARRLNAANIRSGGAVGAPLRFQNVTYPKPTAGSGRGGSGGGGGRTGTNALIDKFREPNYYDVGAGSRRSSVGIGADDVYASGSSSASLNAAARSLMRSASVLESSLPKPNPFGSGSRS
jgi:hypothetical protein